MKKLLMISFVCALATSAAFGQDDTYYTDTSNIETRTPTAPPDMPDYVQPPCPEDGYLWEPGYWAWGILGYYWVPGVWVAPPTMGFLWTPGWWGFYGGFYCWHPGFWGPHVGFYGGINYGFGYPGLGFYGGRWEGGAFHYNTAAWRVNTAVIHRTYASNEGLKSKVAGRAGFNGPGGVHVRPTSGERDAMHETHTRPTAAQQSHHQGAVNDKRQFVTHGGRPATSSMERVNGLRFDHMGHAFGGRGGGRRR